MSLYSCGTMQYASPNGINTWHTSATSVQCAAFVLDMTGKKHSPSLTLPHPNTLSGERAATTTLFASWALRVVASTYREGFTGLTDLFHGNLKVLKGSFPASLSRSFSGSFSRTILRVLHRFLLRVLLTVLLRVHGRGPVGLRRIRPVCERSALPGQLRRGLSIMSPARRNVFPNMATSHRHGK